MNSAVMNKLTRRSAHSRYPQPSIAPSQTEQEKGQRYIDMILRRILYDLHRLVVVP